MRSQVGRILPGDRAAHPGVRADFSLVRAISSREFGSPSLLLPRNERNPHAIFSIKHILCVKNRGRHGMEKIRGNRSPEVQKNAE